MSVVGVRSSCGGIGRLHSVRYSIIDSYAYLVRCAVYFDIFASLRRFPIAKIINGIGVIQLFRAIPCDERR